MGWRNFYIKINENNTVDDIEKFVDHHNNFTKYMTKEEMKVIEENDLFPGEDLSFRILVQKTDDTENYWAYLGNFGGGYHTEMWAEKYFPELELLHSGSFPHYGEEWNKWPIMSLEEYKSLNK